MALKSMKTIQLQARSNRSGQSGHGLTTFRAKLTFDPYFINIIIIRAGFRGGVEGVFPENENAI